MLEKECIPFAPSLIESMRSLGYSFQSAIADLIDNSISAKSTKITINSEPGSSPSLMILDNGIGMTQHELFEAMRYGSKNPLDSREECDLGRFGLGLKSASLSQCRKLIVVSKKNGEINSYSWDLDFIVNHGQWMLKQFSKDEIKLFPHIDMLLQQNSGTCVYLENFDRIQAATANLEETFNTCLTDMRNHLSLVFHRFIEDGLKIEVNKFLLEAQDPFLINNKATQQKKEDFIYYDNKKIILKPFILPHISKMSETEIKKAGGRENLKNEQGFYVYRNKRLIIWGTWFRLARKDELNKLARVRVDIPNTLDYMWSIDIKKSTASLPDIIKKNMYNAIYESVQSSESVHTYRGRKEKKDKNIDYIWERIVTRDGCNYVINREIPQIKIFEETLNEEQKNMLDLILQSFEKSIPVNALYVDAAKGNIENNLQIKKDEIDELWSELLQQINYIKKNNLNMVSFLKTFAKTEPYCNYPEIKNKLQEEVDKYEQPAKTI